MGNVRPARHGQRTRTMSKINQPPTLNQQSGTYGPTVHAAAGKCVCVPRVPHSACHGREGQAVGAQAVRRWGSGMCGQVG